MIAPVHTIGRASGTSKGQITETIADTVEAIYIQVDASLQFVKWNTTHKSIVYDTCAERDAEISHPKKIVADTQICEVVGCSGGRQKIIVVPNTRS